MTLEQYAVVITVISAIVAIVVFFVAMSMRNSDMSKNFDIHVAASEKHGTEVMEYQAKTTEKINGFSVKIESIERMGVSLITGQAQNEIVMNFMRDISKDTKEAIEKMGSSFDHLANVLDRMGRDDRHQ